MNSVYVINRFDIFYGEVDKCTTWTIHKTEKGAMEMLKRIALDMGYELNDDGKSTHHKEEEWKDSYYKIEKTKLFD